MIKNNYSLVIPSWYPTEESPHNGIFIQKHVKLISGFMSTQVVYATLSNKKQRNRFQIHETYKDNLREVIVDINPSAIRVLNQLFLLWGFYKGFRYVLKKRGKPSIIHQHVVYPAGIFALLVSVLYNIPLLITEHWSGYTDEDGRFRKLPFLQKSIIRIVFMRAKGISIVSNFLKSALIKQGLIHNKTTKSIILIPNVLNSNKSNLPQRKKTDGQSNSALCIANLNDHEKNVSLLLYAVEKVLKINRALTLTIVGNGPDRKKLEDIVHKSPLLNKHVTFAGSVPNNEIADYYLKSDFFVLSSNFETFNIAAAEAIMHGLPVVATRCGGPEEYVNASNGLLVEKNNVNDLAGGILKMIESYHSYDSKRISDIIKLQFGTMEIRKRFQELYYNVITP